jgi:signal transduction histidine kinase
LRECAAALCERNDLAAECLRLELGPCVVEGPREDLRIVFRNLIDNAIKYAAPEPQVRLSLRGNQQGEPVIQVEDNGRGIPAHLRRQIFRRFVRLGRELERDRPGTGLGLYIVREYLQRLRARIRVRDGSRGVGTTFEVTLPKSMLRTPLNTPADEAVAPRVTA